VPLPDVYLVPLADVYLVPLPDVYLVPLPDVYLVVGVGAEGSALVDQMKEGKYRLLLGKTQAGRQDKAR
jgi:hypothetical protein